MNCLKCYSRGCIIEGSKDEDIRWKAIEGCRKLDIYDYYQDIPEINVEPEEIVEVRFKNTRREFLKNTTGQKLFVNDIVATEAEQGHDIGIVSLTGELVQSQMKRLGGIPKEGIKKIYRKARPADIVKWKSAIELEYPTMIKARQLASSLNLEMKIGDVEYQGDKSRAYFYYIAEQRVDFRELIKILKDEFRVNIKMHQIGARQEAGRIGGIGPCGRELCCATWMSDFVSVTTTAARKQDISPNPQKLAGQCSKLKCCLNYELDTYVDAQKNFPRRYDQIDTVDGTMYFFKVDTLRGQFTFSSDPNMPANLLNLSLQELHEVLDLNKSGKKYTPKEVENPVKLSNGNVQSTDYVVAQDSLTRFDKNQHGKNRNKNKHNKNRQPNRNNPNNENR